MRKNSYQKEEFPLQLKENDLQEKYLSIPQNGVGLVIGKRGSALKEIQKESGAQIILPETIEQTHSHVLILILGSPLQISKAIEIIESKLEILYSSKKGKKTFMMDILPETILTFEPESKTGERLFRIKSLKKQISKKSKLNSWEDELENLSKDLSKISVSQLMEDEFFSKAVQKSIRQSFEKKIQKEGCKFLIRFGKVNFRENYNIHMPQSARKIQSLLDRYDLRTVFHPHLEDRVILQIKKWANDQKLEKKEYSIFKVHLLDKKLKKEVCFSMEIDDENRVKLIQVYEVQPFFSMDACRPKGEYDFRINYDYKVPLKIEEDEEMKVYSNGFRFDLRTKTLQPRESTRFHLKVVRQKKLEEYQLVNGDLLQISKTIQRSSIQNEVEFHSREVAERIANGDDLKVTLKSIQEFLESVAKYEENFFSN